MIRDLKGFKKGVYLKPKKILFNSFKNGSKSNEAGVLKKIEKFWKSHFNPTVFFTCIFLFLFIFLINPFYARAENYLLIFAGAGMRLPLDVIGKEFGKLHRVQVIYDYEGSGRLGNKIFAGQKPDLFIPGSEIWANILKKKGYIKSCFPIAYHIPVIITPLNDFKVNSLKDFLKKDVRLVLGDPKACAIGKIDKKIFKKAGLKQSEMNVIALGLTVKQLVHWIEGNNADASIVWRADAIQSGKVRIVYIPEKLNVIIKIPVCIMAQAPHKKLAEKYVKYLLTDGKIVFSKYGFKILK